MTLRIITSAVIALTCLAACSAVPSEPAKAAASNSIAVNGVRSTMYATTGSSVYTVQGFTTRNGAFYGGCNNSSISYAHWEHYVAPNEIHKDSIEMYTLDAGCQNSMYNFNGGWINVYEVRDGVDSYVGQVAGNLVLASFKYSGSPIQIKLVAFADQTQNCVFDAFEGYGVGVNSVTIEGSGTLPYARFIC